MTCAGSGGTGGGSQDCVRVLRNEPRREKRELVRDIVEVVRDIVEPVRDSVEVVRDIVEPVRANVFRVVSDNEVRVGRESSRAGRGVPSGMDLREGRGAGSRLYDEGGADADGGVDTAGGVDDADGELVTDGDDEDVAGEDFTGGGRGVDSESGVRTCCAPVVSETFSGSEADDGVDECIAGFVEDNAGSVCDLGSPGRRVVLER
ncbi:hypothetical protein GGF50DRAFT_124426 [Schizophyllum commune]